MGGDYCHWPERDVETMQPQFASGDTFIGRRLPRSAAIHLHCMVPPSFTHPTPSHACNESRGRYKVNGDDYGLDTKNCYGTSVFGSST